MSASVEQIKTKLDELVKRHKAASSKKSALSGHQTGKKEELLALKKEIEYSGHDPRHLKETRDTLQEELTSMMDEFERDLAKVETALAAFEKKE